MLHQIALLPEVRRALLRPARRPALPGLASCSGDRGAAPVRAPLPGGLAPPDPNPLLQHIYLPLPSASATLGRIWKVERLCLLLIRQKRDESADRASHLSKDVQGRRYSKIKTAALGKIACLSGGVTDRARASVLPRLAPSMYPGAPDTVLKSMCALLCAALLQWCIF